MKILVIKLGALGDVVRTLPIAEAIKKKYPNSELTWITKQNALQLFENNPYVDKVFPIPHVLADSYDLLYNFDIEEEATSLASQAKADKKLGFYSESGFPSAFNLGAEYYLNTLFDDELKRTNKKTYQEIMFNTAEIQYQKEKPMLFFTQRDKEYADKFVKDNFINTSKLIGIHMGAGPRWPSKAWGESQLKDFIKKAKKENYNILLFGGPDEVEKIDSLVEILRKQNLIVYKNNPHNTIKEFASLVNLCQKMICSDSFSLHISLALNKQTICLFFCTPPDEIEGYGILKKLVSPMLYDFFPERMDQFSEELVNSISADDVLNALSIS